jgi:hypothetical protein
MFNQKKKIINIISVAIIFSIFQKAMAETPSFGLFVEPAITYERGDSSTNFPSPLSNSSGSINGFGIGARVGFHLYDAFFIALDGRFSRPHFLDSAVNYDAYSDSSNWGAIVGLQVPNIGMRVWAGPLFGSTLDPKESETLISNFKIAQGIELVQVLESLK